MTKNVAYGGFKGFLVALHNQTEVASASQVAILITSDSRMLKVKHKLHAYIVDGLESEIWKTIMGD